MASPAWIDVGAIDDFPRGRGRAVDADGTRVAVFRLDGGWYALRDACPHMGASLADGKLDDLMVTCFWHGWKFHVGTGETPDHGNFCARVYRVAIERGRVRVLPPPPKPAPDDGDDDAWVKWDDAFLKKRDAGSS